MPELADVEGLRSYLARHAKGKRIENVSVHDAGVLRNTSARDIGRKLKGMRFGLPERTGKWIIVPADSSYVLLHFGMTGGLHWVTGDEKRDRSDRLTFRIDGGELRYHSQRKLGGVWLARDRNEVSEITGPLGPDAKSVRKKQFHELIAHTDRALKVLLMDQQRIAGLGNELADEILWQARMHPSTPASELEPRRVDALYATMRDVLTKSVKRGQIPDEPGWLKSVRGDREARCPRCRTAIRKIKVGGRTTYMCPKCQKR